LPGGSANPPGDITRAWGTQRRVEHPAIKIFISGAAPRILLTQLGVERMKVRPLHDRIIVQRLDEGEQKVGGIIIPDTAKEKPQQGKVFAVGAGKFKEDGERQPLDVKDGDTILFGKYSGQEIKIDGEEYLIMREDEVLAVLESKGKK
jgi:chaperonin GroES